MTWNITMRQEEVPTAHPAPFIFADAAGNVVASIVFLDL